MKLRSAKAFLDGVETAPQGTRPVNTEAVTRAVLQVLNHYLDPDQVANVRGALSKPVRRLWPERAIDLEEQATERPEPSLERTEP